MSRALILTGGAFRGMVQIPVMEYLKGQHDYDAVYGCSVGSINGVLFAQDDMEILKELWNSVDGLPSFLKLKWWNPISNGFYSMKPLMEKIEKHTSLDRLKIPFTAAVTSFNDGEYYNLNSKEMWSDKELWDAIGASACMAPIMEIPTIKIGRKMQLVADGGYRSIIPIPTDKNYEYLDVVCCTPLERIKSTGKELTKTNLLQVGVKALEIFEAEIFHKDIEELKTHNFRELRIFYPPEYTGSSLDASKEMIKKRYQLGLRALENPLIIKK
jgi:predicted acylesterase/phospholipase RssA